MSLEDLFIIEICAGWEWPQDFRKWHTNVASEQWQWTTRLQDPVVFLFVFFDLTDPDDLERMVQFIEESADSILGIWIAPSCGTCSRAREKRLVSLERAGVKTPIPLRSLLQPDQLDGLTGLDKVKVEKANMLYDAVYVLASLACSLHIFVGIENPTNSHYWSTTPMRKLCDEQEYHYGDVPQLCTWWRP